MYTPPQPLDDIERERHADSSSLHPLPVNRSVLAKVVERELNRRVERVAFISAGTFHKAFLITLRLPSAHSPPPANDKTNGCSEVVIRLALPYMPSLKTLSEIGTMAYLQATCPELPIPTVYAYDASANNVLGAEWILMSKAPGVPLSRIHSPYPRALLANLARLVLTVSKLRFAAIGSIYIASALKTSATSPPPTPISLHQYSSLPLSRDIGADVTPSSRTFAQHHPDFTIGPLISWPFFGSSRGLLPPSLLNRGPWRTADAYLESCSRREIDDVIRENEGRVKGRRPMRRPSTDSDGSGSSEDDKADRGEDADEEDEISSRTSSSESGEGLTDEDYEDMFYRDYRASQRSTFLVAHTNTREAKVKAEMSTALGVFGKLLVEWEDWMREHGGESSMEGGDFGLDLHDLSRENVFVDENDHTKVTCVIDWESITTRPLWQTHHLPSFLEHHHHHGHGHGHGHHHHHHHHHHQGHHSHHTHYGASRPHSGTHSRSQSKFPTPNPSGRYPLSPLSPLSTRTSTVHQFGVSPLTPLTQVTGSPNHQTTPRPHPPSRSNTSHHGHTHHHHHHHHHHAHRMNEHMFLEEMAALPGGSEWIEMERHGRELRKAHRVFEWDGWEEGLIPSCLGLDSQEEEGKNEPPAGLVANNPANGLGLDLGATAADRPGKHLDSEGDMCGGVGGELGRRLEALVVNGFPSPSSAKRYSALESNQELSQVDSSSDIEREEVPYYDGYSSSSSSSSSSSEDEGSSSTASSQEEAGGAPDPGQVHVGFHNFQANVSRTHLPLAARTPFMGLAFLPLNEPVPGESPALMSSFPPPRSSSGFMNLNFKAGAPLNVRTSPSPSHLTPAGSTPGTSSPITPTLTGSYNRQHQPEHIYRHPGYLAPLAGPSDAYTTSKYSQASGGKTQSSSLNQGTGASRAAQTKNRLAMFLVANGLGD